MTKLLLSIPEAAERLSIGRSKLYELLTSGEIPTIRIGRAVRIPADELDAFVTRERAAQREPVEAA